MDRLIEEKFTKKAQDVAGLDKAAADEMALDILDEVLEDAGQWVAEQIDATIAKI
jgi:hypothetical protein